MQTKSEKTYQFWSIINPNASRDMYGASNVILCMINFNDYLKILVKNNDQIEHNTEGMQVKHLR